jgi:hypothetical protein
VPLEPNTSFYQATHCAIYLYIMATFQHMALRSTYRIHLAPQGYEDERIYKPAIEHDADKVVLLIHGDDSDLADECQETVEEALDKEGIEVLTRECDIFNPNRSARQIIDVIEEFPDDDVFVNISTGSKITAVTGTMACMKTGATPYYARAEDYGDETVTKNVTESIEIPALPLNEPDSELIQILEYIRSRNEAGDPVSKKDLIEFANDRGLPCVSGSNRSQEANKYDLIGPVVSTLKNRDFVTERRDGNKRILTITDVGEGALQMYHHEVERELLGEADDDE